MPLRNAKPLIIRPKGVCDALDGTNAFKGAMSSLSNLIPDVTTTDLFVPRPAAVELVNLAAGDISGFVSTFLIIGNVVYGMGATGGGLAGFDIPFTYNIATNTTSIPTGANGGNIPSSPPPTGNWVPPTMDLIGTKIIVAHSGFSGTGSNFFGVIDITNPAAPTWTSANTAVNALPSVPTVVKNFNNRAYFACGNEAFFSDVLDPVTMTNSTQFLTLGDTTPIVAYGTLPLNTTAGGVVASLIAFKNTIIYQIAGDLALMDLTLAAIPSGVGTYAPLSLANTPEGLAFISPDGLRMVNLLGNVTQPIGANGEGISVPFITALVPSRISAAYNVDVLRISVGTVEYWYHTTRKAWTGPHTFPASLIGGYQDSFVLAPLNVLFSLWQSDIIVNIDSVYVENSVDLQFDYQTVLLPDTNLMSENCIVETTIMLAFQSGAGNISASFLNENQNTLNSVNITGGGTPTIWGNFIWGQVNWLGTLFNLQQLQIPWTIPIVFKQGYVNISGASFFGFKIGNLYLKYQPLGYLI